MNMVRGIAVDVAGYIERQKSPQKEILHEVRKIFHEKIQNCEEKITWGVITYSKGKFYIAAMKDRVHVGFAITGLSKDELNLLEGNGKLMRHIKIPSVESIDKEKLMRLIELVNKKVACKPC